MTTRPNGEEHAAPPLAPPARPDHAKLLSMPSVHQVLQLVAEAEAAARRVRVEQVAAAVREVTGEGRGLREAFVSPDGNEVIFVGDDWTSQTDRVSDLLDAIGLALDPNGETFIWGGLHLRSEGLEGYTRVPLG